MEAMPYRDDARSWDVEQSHWAARGCDMPALSGALRRLASPDQRRPLAHAGRARAMQLFSDDAVAERTLTFWRDLLG